MSHPDAPRKGTPMHRGPYDNCYFTPFCVINHLTAMPCANYDEAVRTALAVCSSREPMVGIYGAGVENLVAVALFHPEYGRVVTQFPKY